MINLLGCTYSNRVCSLALQGCSDEKASCSASARYSADQRPWSMAESTASAGQHDEWLPQDREDQEASNPQQFLNFSFKNLELLGKKNQEMMNSIDAKREGLSEEDLHEGE